MRFGKRGVSAVIAIVLLILLVLALVSLVFFWARGFVEEKTDTSDFSAGELCSAVDFSIIVVSKAGTNYSFEAVNRGNIDVASLKFKIYTGGNIKIVDFSAEILAGAAVSDYIVLSGVIDKVEVLGVLDGKLVGRSSEIVCEDDPVYLEGF